MIDIREARAVDLDAVTALFLRCWRESYAGFLSEPVVAVFDESSARELWRRALDAPRPGTQGFVALADGRVVGITRLGPDPDESTAGHVFSLYVDPSAQGAGVGGQLLHAADRWFAAHGMSEATLWVFEANTAARGFYARHGWQPDGGTRVEAEFGEPELRYRRTQGEDPGMTDVIVVGGGHNGLVCAAYLARSGLDVLVLERRAITGGAVATEELFPGFQVSSCSFTTHILQDRVVADLALHRHGLRVHRLDPELLVPFPDGSRLLLWRDVARVQQELAALDPHDAAAYPAWCDFWLRVGRLLDPYFLDERPPTLAELQVRLSGTDEGRLLDRLIHAPVREVLDEHFRDPRVQAALLGNVDIRSLDTPGELMGWASVKPNLLVDPMNQGLLPGGMGTLARALERAALAAGARIRTGAEVRRIIVDDRGMACGVELADGQAIHARTVVSNADPKRTFLGLVEPAAVSVELRARIGGLETRSGSVKFHAAVRELPDFGRWFQGPLDPRALAMIRISPSIDYVTASLADAEAGKPTRSPIITLQIPTVYDPTIAPPGQHIVSMWVKFQPTRLASGSWDDVRDSVREQLIDVVTGYAPNFRASIIDTALYTPLDMEQRVGLTDGSIHHLDHSVTQLLGDRLFPGGGYRTPVPGLYMCGAGTHPGGEVSGAPGHNAARVILADLAGLA